MQNPTLTGHYFKNLVDSITDFAIFMLDLNGKITFWNSGAEKLLHYSEAQILGRHVSILYPAYEREFLPEQDLEASRNAGRWEAERWRMCNDGSRVWANVVLSLRRDETDTPVGYTGVIRDLTGRRDTLELLRQSEERFRLMIESVKDYAIFMLSPEGIIETWNPGAQRLKGYTAAEVIGKHFSMFYARKDRLEHTARELEFAVREGRYEEEGWRVRKDGTQFWALVVISAVFDEHGKLRGFAKVTRDLTERKKGEEGRLKLEQERIARLEAERSNRMKDEFLAVVSHELRTPLMPIIGWSKILQEKSVAGYEQARGLQIIERNAHAQARLIEDLLDVSAIVSGKIKLNLRPVGLAQIIETSIDGARQAAQKQNVLIRFTMEDSVDPIQGDPVRLQQIISNLLTNAVKFSNPGGLIEVRLRRETGTALISVRDQGAGIEADYLPHVFERFSQYDSTSTRKHGGLGIGLSVVRQLAQLHGGRVTADSEGIGKGATFTVELPIPAHPPSVHPAPQVGEGVDNLENTSLLGKTVLVVDDEDDAREFLGYALRRCGAEVLLASSAPEALELWGQAKVDVLVSDIGMPGENGYSLIGKIRSLGSQTPAVAVTAYARGEDAARAMDAGFQRHLAKPVNPDELCAVVVQMATKQ